LLTEVVTLLLGTHVPLWDHTVLQPPGRGDIPAFAPSRSWYSI